MIARTRGILAGMASPVIHIPGYEYVRELGVGGMATVYLAIQRSLDRSVAIKVMKRAGADENFEKRFLLEGRTMAKLPHRNIVGVYDIVQNDEINYIAMEYLGGGTLSDRLRNGLALSEAISIVVQVAGALQYAHDNHVVHRDLKPANIMFRDQHTPVLTDFGIARAKDHAATRLTQTGMMIGTPTYMSPEQAMGTDVDGRSDQYSLGVLFYEMLTGAPPFGGETPLNVVLAHINQAPPPLPHPFTGFQPILDRMLSKDREQRYPDLNIFVHELKAMLTGSDTLLAKLQIDPSQSASEQLRALGFSESQINTGSRRAAAIRNSGQRPGPRQTGPGVRFDPDPEPLPPPRPRWLLPAGIAAVVLGLGLALWAAFGGRDELDPAVRALVNDSLAVVDRMIAEGKLVAPAGDNANEKLQQVLQAAPDLPEAIERQQRIVAALTALAGKSLEGRNFEAAEIRVSEALAVSPDNPEIKALQQRIASAKIGAEREARVAALLLRAANSRKAGNLYGSGTDNALLLVRQALEIDAQSATARAELTAITTQAMNSADAALEAGRLDDAGRLLDATAAYFANEPAWQKVSVDLEKARKVAQQQTRIDGFIVQAREHVAAGRYAEPAGDNALESLARVAELDPSNSAAAALRREVGVALSRSAKEAERGGDVVQALERYDQALLAQPDNAEYTAAKRALQQRLGERESQLASALGSARAAINARRYLGPAGDNARDYIEAALKLDPNNADARRLRDGLPDLVRNAATELGQEARYDDALALLATAIQEYPGDAQFAALKRSFESEREQLRNVEQRQQRIAQLQGLLASGQLGAENARAIGAGVAELLKADPQDAEALRLREGFLAAIAGAIAAADSPERLTLLEPVLAQARQQLGAEAADVAALQATFEQARSTAEERERARIAAISGTLLLNAYPWADVDSVVDQGSGKAVALPRDRATPLRLSVPAGTYRVTFKHPQVPKTVALVASVTAQKVQVANASFPTLTSRDYLKRAGYAQ
jgi:serine/threonine-protein kinase PpkA